MVDQQMRTAPIPRPAGKASISTGIRYFRETLDAPDFSRLGRVLRNRIGTVAATLPDLKPLAPELVAVASDEGFARLRHELSGHYLALNRIATEDGRSMVEADTLRWLEAGPEAPATADVFRFREWLAAINRRLTDNDKVWRNRAIRLGGDRAGNHVNFPPLSAIPNQLEKLRLVLVGVDDPPLFKAAVAYVLLLNCHPFCDGNGRTARVLFNYVLRRNGMPENVYLPLYEINGRSHGGYEIALRMAEIQGDWEPFLRYLLNVVQCYQEISG